MKQYTDTQLQQTLEKIQQLLDNIETWEIELTKRPSPYIQRFCYQCDEYKITVDGSEYNYDIAVTYYQDEDTPPITWLVSDSHRNDALDPNLDFLTSNSISSLKKIGYSNLVAEFANTGLAQQVYRKLLEIYPEPAQDSPGSILSQVNNSLDKILSK